MPRACIIGPKEDLGQWRAHPIEAAVRMSAATTVALAISSASFASPSATTFNSSEASAGITSPLSPIVVSIVPQETIVPVLGSDGRYHVLYELQLLNTLGAPGGFAFSRGARCRQCKNAPYAQCRRHHKGRLPPRARPPTRHDHIVRALRRARSHPQPQLQLEKQHSPWSYAPVRGVRRGPVQPAAHSLQLRWRVGERFPAQDSRCCRRSKGQAGWHPTAVAGPRDTSTRWLV